MYWRGLIMRQTDYFILCCRCCARRCISPRPPTKPPGYIFILSRKTLSTSSRPKCATPIHAIRCGHSSCILSTEVCCLGELTLVLELGHQSFMRDVGDIAAAMVASIPQDYSASTMRTTQAGTRSCILCNWSREISCFLGGRGITCLGSSFTIHLLRRPSRLSIQYPSHRIQSGGLLGSTFDDSIWIHHIYANFLA